MNDKANEPDALDLAIESGDMDAIEAAMNDAAATANEDLNPTADDDPIVLESGDLEAAAAKTEVEPGAEAAKAAEDDGAPTGIATKNGDGVIPYSELEGARERERVATEHAVQLQSQLDGMKQDSALSPELVTKVETAERLLAIRTSQLEQLGVDPTVLPEDEKFKKEWLEGLGEYGEFGEKSSEVFGFMQRKIESLEGMIRNTAHNPAGTKSEAATAEPSDTEVLQANPDMVRWNDSDLAWDVVKKVNDYVATIPEFVGKSLSERMPKIVELTKKQLGESAGTIESKAEIDLKAKKAIDESNKPPTSLSELGGQSLSSEKTEAEQMEGMNELEIAAHWEKKLAAGASVEDLMGSAEL